MAPRDPTTDIEPNFESEEWLAVRQTMLVQGESEEQVVEALRKAWRDQHQKNVEAWTEHQQQQNETNVNPPNPAVDSGVQPLEEEERPEWLNQPTPSFLDVLPASHVMKKLEKKEFVELWYFTAKGCRDAASLESTAPDETFSIINTDNGLMLQSVGATAVSSKVVKDEFLSFEQWTEGKEGLLSCMEICGWKSYEIQELAKFFFRLGRHPLKKEDFGLRAVMRYQEQVRRNWTLAIRKGSNAYAISDINDTLIQNFHRQILNEVQMNNSVRVVRWIDLRDSNVTTFCFSTKCCPVIQLYFVHPPTLHHMLRSIICFAP